MNENELILQWKTSADNLEKSMALSKQNAKEIMKLKTKDALSSLKPIKMWAVLIGIIWVIAVDAVIIHFWDVAPYPFLISALVQVIITKIAIGIYLYQLVLLQQVDISEPVISTQEKLLHLKISSLWVVRISFLQLPIWTTFYWNESMLSNGNWLLWIFQGAVTLLFILLTIWLFINITVRNSNKKWFRFVLNLKEWSPLIQAIDLLHQAEAYRMEDRSVV